MEAPCLSRRAPKEGVPSPLIAPDDGLEEKAEGRTTNLRKGGNSRIDVEKELSPHGEDARARSLGAEFF